MSNINEPKFIRQMDVLAEGTGQRGDKETARVSRDMKGEGEGEREGGAKRSLKWEARRASGKINKTAFAGQQL